MFGVWGKKTSMIVKKHLNEGKLILAICDSDILGKKFSENNIQLDLTSNFYKGEELNDNELKKLCKIAFSINAVGKKSISFLKKQGLAADILNVEGIPHTQIFTLS